MNAIQLFNVKPTLSHILTSIMNRCVIELLNWNYIAEEVVSPRRLRIAFETRAPPAPRATAMDPQASKRRGRSSAGGTGVGVATGGCGKRGRGSGRRGAFRDLGVALRWAAHASAGCCPGTLRGTRPGSSSRRRAAFRVHLAARRA
jgi:hypothetical protein